MKKILSQLGSKVILFSSLGLCLSLYGFWNYQQYQGQTNQLQALNNAVNTCFARVNQTFTAMMIAQAKSPYLDKEFIALTDECLSETTKMLKNPKQILGKSFDLHQQLISESHWFHEKVNRLGLNTAIEKGSLPATTLLSDRYAKLETFKLDLTDGIDLAVSERAKIQVNTEYVMGVGLIVVVLSLMLLGLREFERAQLHRELESEALKLLKTDTSFIASLVDRLVLKALSENGYKISEQLFRDYHESILSKTITKKVEEPLPVVEITPEETSALVIEELSVEEAPVEAIQPIALKGTSLTETIDELKKLFDQDLILFHAEKDHSLELSKEDLAQVLSAALTKLKERSLGQKKISVSVTSEGSDLSLKVFQPEATFHAFELDYFDSQETSLIESMDIHLVLLKEIARDLGLKMKLENTKNDEGQITGMMISLILKKIEEDEKPKNLISVMKGKKRDLFKELIN